MNNSKKIVCLHESDKSLTEQEARRINRHPGSRLAKARRLNGFNKRRQLSDHLAEKSKGISYARLGSLERNETEPTLAEINTLCDELGMSSDWYLRDGYTPKNQLLNQINKLSIEGLELLSKYAEAVNCIELKLQH